MSKIIFLLLGVFTCLFGFSAQAETVEGTVQFRASQPYLQLSSSKEPFQIFGLSASVTNDLLRLKSGDFVSAQGVIYAEKKIVTIDSIDVVGLRDLIGVWRASGKDFFEFRDFDELNFYSFEPRPQGIEQKKVQLSYTIVPDDGNRWTIFLADDHSVHIGSLQIKTKGINMKLLNPETGEVTHDINLSPYSVKK